MKHPGHAQALAVAEVQHLREQLAVRGEHIADLRRTLVVLLPVSSSRARAYVREAGMHPFGCPAPQVHRHPGARVMVLTRADTENARGAGRTAPHR